MPDRCTNPECEQHWPAIRPRLLSCVQQWPECVEGDYNPACCRFPKSCSCTVYSDDINPALLEQSGRPTHQTPEPVKFDLPTVATEGEEPCRARSPHGGRYCQLPLWHKELQHYERHGDDYITWLDEATILAMQGPADE